ncbi:MAG: serine--tRNA ligase [Patescibacteria group bacterium]
MLSVDYIRNNKEEVIRVLKNKKREADVDKILELDRQKNESLLLIQKLREERNILSKKTITQEGKERGKKIKQELKIHEEELKSTEEQLSQLISYIPNIPLEEVPIGADASGNIVKHAWGNLPKFDFAPLSHIELGKKLDIIDTERGTKTSGFRGYFLKNQGAVLHISLMFYAFQKLIQKGFIPLIAPSIVKGFTLFGSGQFPWGKDEVYKLNDDDAYLAGTSEAPVSAYFSGEILSEDELPKKFTAFSPCFRKEAGSYGKDTKGLYRVHEFWKIEQIIIAKNDVNQARILHEELQKNAEELLQDLGLPYQVLLMCTGDMGEPQIKKYDIETWMPSRNSYGETMSNSIMGDFQTRRLNIKYRKRDGSKEYCFTLNNTALASPRILIALLENFQEKDGSVRIPKVLHTLTGFDKIPVAK